MGGLWVDYERTADGRIEIGSPRNQQTNIPGLYAIGECDYQYHGANRLGANSLLSCIFSGLIVAPRIETLLGSLKGGSAADQPASLVRAGPRHASKKCTTHSLRRSHRRRKSVSDAPGTRPT